MTSGRHETDGGLWREVLRQGFDGRPALFLDRDGVIIADKGYVGRAADVDLLPGAAEAIATCNRLGVAVVVVSNQSGIARGLYGWDGFDKVQALVTAALGRAGGRLDAVLACAHHGAGRAPFNVEGHPWRKPNPGMILEAATLMRLDLARSWVVGDRASDLAAGQAAKVRGGVLIDPGGDAAERERAAALSSEHFAVEFARSLADAVSYLVSRRDLGRTGG